MSDDDQRVPLVTIPIAHSRRLQPVAAAPASGAGVAVLATGVADAADGAGSRRATTASAMRRRHVGRDAQDIVELAVVAARPAVRLVAPVDQRRQHAHAIAGDADAAFDAVAGARGAVARLRRARQHVEPIGAAMGQLRDQLLDQRGAEAVVRRLAARHERPHQDPRTPHGDRPPLVDAARGVEAPDEAVAAPRHRLDEARLERVVAERHAQPPDGGVDAVLEVDRRAVGPQPALDVLARDHAAGVLHEQGQDLERLLLQADRLAAATDLVPAHVDLDAADANDRRGQRRAGHRAGCVRTPPEISERRHSRCCRARARALLREWIRCSRSPARRRRRCGSAG